MRSSLGNNSRDTDIINIDDLVDIQDVVIDTSLPKEERIQSYLEQIKNPYCYRCDDMIVRVSFANTEVTLEDRLQQYLLSGNRTTTL
jgi:RecJ-like exonuclease